MTSRALTLLAALCACTPTSNDTASSTGTSTDPAGTTTTETTASTTTTETTPTTGMTGSTGSTGGMETGASTTTGTTVGTRGTDTGEEVLCEGTGQSSLPGVTIVVPPQTCVFTLAEAMAGITFQYSVEVAEAVDEVTPQPNDAGNCAQPDASGLIVSAEVDGNGQHYCICDQGLCQPPSDPPVSLVPGSYPDTFEWNGVNWNGPSDTNNPFGPPFPPGEYLLNIRATGKFGAQPEDFAVLASFPVTIVP